MTGFTPSSGGGSADPKLDILVKLLAKTLLLIICVILGVDVVVPLF